MADEEALSELRQTSGRESPPIVGPKEVLLQELSDGKKNVSKKPQTEEELDEDEEFATETEFAEWEGVAEKHRMTMGWTYLNFFRAYIGTGIIFLPSAFRQGGILFSAIFFCFLAFAAVHSSIMIVDCKRKVVEDFKKGLTHGVEEHKQHVSLGVLAWAAFQSRKAMWLVNFSLMLSQFGFGGAGLIFFAQNVQALLEYFSNCAMSASVTALIWIQVPFLVPASWVRQLRAFSSIVMISNALTFGCVLLVYGYSISKIAGDGPQQVPLFQPKTFAVYIGTVMYSLEGTAYVLPIEHAMQDQDKFKRAARVSGFGVLVLYLSFGIVGYLAFGSAVRPIVLLNLQKAFVGYPDSHVVAAVILLFSLSVFIMRPFVLYPIFKIMEPGVFGIKKSKGITALKNLLRACIVALAAAGAMLGAQSFEHLVAVIGGLCSVPLMLIYPPLIHLLVLKGQLSYWTIACDLLMLLCGILGCIASTTIAIQEWNAPHDFVPYCPR